MDAGLLHGLWTAALLAAFAAIVVWAWSGRRKREFEAAARLPLEDDALDAAAAADANAADHTTAPAAAVTAVETTAAPGATEPPRGARHG